MKLWARLKFRLWCWWHKAEALPFGAVTIEGLWIANTLCLEGNVPADMFFAESFGVELQLPILEPGRSLRMIVKNHTQHELPFVATAVADTSVHARYALAFPPTVLKPLHEHEISTQSMTACQVRRLMISLPKFVKKAKH
jgi:hypothetical protein